jgi:hypothetical protein
VRAHGSLWDLALRIPKRFEEFPPFSVLAYNIPVLACGVHKASQGGCKRDCYGKKGSPNTVVLVGLNPLTASTGRSQGTEFDIYDVRERRDRKANEQIMSILRIEAGPFSPVYPGVKL